MRASVGLMLVSRLAPTREAAPLLARFDSAWLGALPSPPAAFDSKVHTQQVSNWHTEDFMASKPEQDP